MLARFRSTSAWAPTHFTRTYTRKRSPPSSWGTAGNSRRPSWTVGWSARAPSAKAAARRSLGPLARSQGTEEERMGLFGGAKTIVGLDIGSSRIKAVERRKAPGEIEVAVIW